MFRELTRKKQELSAEECVAILKSEKRGVLSVNSDDNYPYGMPMNHFYDEEDGKIYFHCGREGHRTDALKKNSKVSFCVYTDGYCDAGEWALNIKSVIVFGKIEIVENMDRIIDIAKKISHKFTMDDEYIRREIDLYARQTILLELTPEYMCGKLVKES